MTDHVQIVVAGEDMVTLELVAEDVVAPTARAGRRQARRQGGGQAGVAVGGRRREVKGEGDGGRARMRWGWVEVILRVSLEVILHNLLRHSSTG